jgi:hypothetical protein
MKKIVSLDEVLLTPVAVEAWHAGAQKIANALFETGFDPSLILDEQAEVCDDGSLFVFLQLPEGVGEARLKIPAGQWSWRQ